MARPYLTEEAERDVFRAIAHPVRRTIVEQLSKGDSDVESLSHHFDISLPALSQHLAVLRAAGIVDSRREGQRRVYRLKLSPLRKVVRWSDKIVTRAGRKR